MDYAYGPAATMPYINPYWAYGNFFSGYGYPMWNPALGYGTLPAAAPTFGVPSYVSASDGEIKDFVERAIDGDPAIPALADIDVAVSKGVVTLTGTVPNKRIKHAAGDDAWFIPQALDVHNELEVERHRPSAARPSGHPARHTEEASQRPRMRAAASSGK